MYDLSFFRQNLDVISARLADRGFTLDVESFRQLDAERRRVPGLVEFVEQNEPQLIAFNEYVNDDGTEATVVQVHPDAASMQKHLAIIGERAAQAYDETLDCTLAIQIFGPVDPQMLATMRTQTGEGVSLTIATEHLGGFTRSR